MRRKIAVGGALRRKIAVGGALRRKIAAGGALRRKIAARVARCGAHDRRGEALRDCVRWCVGVGRVEHRGAVRVVAAVLGHWWAG